VQLSHQPTTGTLVLAPVSPAVAKLLHQLQTQLIKEADEHQAIAADPMGALQSPVRRFDHADRIEYQGSNGKDTWRRRRVCPQGWGGADGVPWHPSHWLIDSDRIDSAGRRWHLGSDLILTPHVMDDFGTLVPVDGAQ